MSLNDQIILQKFFKGKLDSKTIDKNFNINLLNYDIFNNDISNLIKLINETKYLNNISLRFSETLTETSGENLKILLNLFIENKQFNSFSFYIKYLDDSLLNIFYDFCEKIPNNIEELKIQIKYTNKNKENIVINNILTKLNNNNNLKLKIFDFTENHIESEENLLLLNNFFSKNTINEVIIGGRYLNNPNININLSNINNFQLIDANISSISSLPIDYLNLLNNNISWKGVQILSNLLSDLNTKLKKLNLSYNFIGDYGCEILSESLKKNNTLFSLDLSYNNITDYGIKKLTSGLLKNNSLKKLNLKNNEINDEGIIFFSENLSNSPFDKFYKLDICSNNFSKNGYIIYSNFLKTHFTNKYLCINARLNDKTQKEFFINCKPLNNLKIIDLYSLDIHEDNLSYLNDILVNNKNIKKIILSNNYKISDDTINEITLGIKNNPQITQIYLSQCKLSDNGIELLTNSLENNNCISELHLDDNEIGKIGLKFLCEKILIKPSLTSLMLGHNNIDSSAVIYFQEYLPLANGIKKLFLNSNHIKDEGCIYLANGIEKNNSLNEINIENNHISNEGIKILSKCLKNKENIMSVNLNSNIITEIDNDFFMLFDWIPTIKIAANKLSDNAIIKLFKAIEGNRLFKNLKFKIDNENFDFNNVNFNNNIFLKKIDLSNNNKNNIFLIKNILNIKNLTYLSLQNDCINDNDISIICNYIIDFNIINLKKLKLISNRITSIGCESMNKMLKLNKSINEINLAGNNIESKGVNYICESLIKDNHTVLYLMFNYTNLNDNCVDTIRQMLLKNKNLLNLSLMSNNLSNKGIDIILSTLRINNTLKILSIGDNKCDDKAYKNLSSYLKFNNSLLQLEIKTNNITYLTINNIAKSFIVNKNLININFVNNNINFESSLRLCQYTFKNESIKEIKLLLNPINGDEKKLLISSSPHIIFN